MTVIAIVIEIEVVAKAIYSANKRNSNSNDSNSNSNDSNNYDNNNI